MRGKIDKHLNTYIHTYIIHILKSKTTTERDVKDYRQIPQQLENEECCRKYQKQICNRSPTREKIQKYMQTDIIKGNKIKDNSHNTNKSTQRQE